MRVGWWFGLLMALSASAMGATSFDHLGTGFELEGAHVNVECSQCHLRGVFVGTPVICERCHDGTGFNALTSKPVTHPRTTEVCAACHTEADWIAVAVVDHSQVQGSCQSCHDGTMASAKPPTHIQSHDACEDCHSTLAWVPAIFDHAGIMSGCSSCHDGFSATGKSPTHITTDNICED